MVRLINIKKENNTMIADYIPESSEKYGHIVVDLSTEEIIENKAVEGFGRMYSGHARATLVKLSKLEEIPTEQLVMWY